MLDEEIIRIVTDDTPQIVAPDGSKVGMDIGVHSWGDEVQRDASNRKVVMKEEGGLNVHEVRVKKLEEEMAHLLQVVERLFDRTEQQANRKPKMQLDEIELSVEINGEGEVSILGTGGKAGGKGAIKLKFKRAEQA